MIDTTTIKSEADRLFKYTKKLRETIHSFPELSFNEYKTSGLIRFELEHLGIEYEQVLETGIIARIGKGEECIALRADIDALPINEQTNAEFASNVKNIMHACGHDTHIAMLLTAAKILKKHEDELNGCVLLIFQPGEEKLPGGAKQIIETGLLNNPKPEFIFGQHVFPAETTGKIALRNGYVMASADELYWTISGKSAHAAQPHLGHNPVLVAAQIITQLQTLVNSTKNPLSPAVLTVTSVHGGSAPNIIPEEIKISGTLRTFDNDLRFELLKKIEEISLSVSQNFGCKCDFAPEIGYPPLLNDKLATKLVRETASELFGEEKISDFEPKMWAEDFSYYYEKGGIPSCFWFLGVRPKNINEMPGLHNPKFLPDEQAMKTGTAMLVSIAFNVLK